MSASNSVDVGSTTPRTTRASARRAAAAAAAAEDGVKVRDTASSSKSSDSDTHIVDGKAKPEDGVVSKRYPGIVISEHGQETDKQMDQHHEYEFGGPVGVFAMMTGFPILMYYLWICLWFYDGQFAAPKNIDDIVPFLGRMWNHVKQDAYPNWPAFRAYGGLMIFQLLLAFIMPGYWQEGLPVPSLDYKTLKYKCNALASFYATLVFAAWLHLSGTYRLTQIIDNFGSYMTVAMIAGFAVSFWTYFHAVFTGTAMRMSGNFFYDLFMGAALNPRIGMVDLKMWAEVRIPWVLLFMIAVSGGCKQYETYGYVTPNMAFMILATGLYINACAKGEECIPQTWDMFYEKGFMVIFWNFAGVPFTYCYSIVYMAAHPPEWYRFSTPTYVALFSLLITAHYIFDSSMAQKSRFRMQLQGTYKPRWTFPQWPWSTLKNPKYIQTEHGNCLLIDGWWQFARKPNYTADLVQSFLWGAIAGTTSIIPYFYFSFFFFVLTHRCGRDFDRCARKYGKDWEKYCKIVPWRFIPYVY